MINLTYNINENIPTYGNGEKPSISSGKQMCNGDSCNTMVINMSNHHGTHVDAPLHFDPNGKSITDYESEFWFCKNVLLVECRLSPAQILDVETLRSCLSKSQHSDKNVDALILKTGWSLRRISSDYWEKPPGFSPNLATFLRSLFPNLKFFGFDIISLSSFTNRQLGREAHKEFLAKEPEILILEDLNLNYFYKNEAALISNLLIAPLMVENSDGSPCTIFANF